MPIKTVKMKISKNKKYISFLLPKDHSTQKIRFLGQKVCPVACLHTDTQTDRVTTVGTLSGFQDFFLQPRNGPIIDKGTYSRMVRKNSQCTLE